MLEIQPIQMNLKDADVPPDFGLPSWIDEDKIRRIATEEDLKHYAGVVGFEWSFGSTFEMFVGNVKEKCLRFDTCWMKLLGYKKVYYRDLYPGSLSIAYEMWGEE